ncbi:MAG: DsbA family protein [Myxococcales bacterium]
MRPLLAALALLAAACQPARAAVRDESLGTAVATSTLGTLTEGDLDRAIAGKPKLAKQLYELRHEALEDLLLQKLVEAEAAKRKTTPEQLLTEVMTKAGAPTDAEVQAFFDKHLSGSGYKLGDIKGQLAERMAAERRQAAIGAFLTDLKSRAKVHILLEPPRVHVEAQGPSTGDPGAKVTIVEFSDFQCPYCRRQEDALHRILTDYRGKVRLVFRDFPLDGHPDAAKAAQAGACADEQGKFWPMHDKLFENQDALSVANLKSYARELGLDGGKFDACLDGDRTLPRIQQSLSEGEKAGVDGTPALFVNGRMLSGATSYEDLRAAVEDELAAAPEGATK